MNKAILVVLPSFENYEDRAYLYYNLITNFEIGIIYFHNRPNVKSLSQINFKYSCPSNNNFIFKWLYLFIFSIKFIYLNKHNNVFIHDHFISRASIIPTFFFHIFGFRITKVLSLYSDTANYYFGRRYKAHFSQKTISEKVYFHFLYLKRFLLETTSIFLSDKVIVNSPEIISGIKKYYGFRKKNYYCINTSVDTDFWTILENDSQRDLNNLLYVGRITKRKGLDYLIQFFLELSNINPSLRLYIAGETSEEDNGRWLLDLVNESGLNEKVYFTGKLNRYQLRKLYNKCAFFIFPSKQEGSPRVVKEALSSGCIVLSADLPGVRLIDSSGSFISFFDFDNITSCVFNYFQVLSSVNSNTFQLKRKFVVNNFSHYVISEKLKCIYE